MDGDAIKAEAVHLIESNIDLSLALAELMSEDSAEGDAVKESYWSDAIELGQKLGATADLLATHELVNKIVANKGGGEYAVKTAKWLQNQQLLDRRLFVSLLLKRLCKISLEVVCHLIISDYLSCAHLTSQLGEEETVNLLCQLFSSKDVSILLLQELSRCLVFEVYSNSSASSACPSSLTANLIAALTKEQYSVGLWAESSRTLLDTLVNCTSPPHTILKQLYLDLLGHYLSPPKVTLSPSDVIPSQEQRRSSALPQEKTALFSSLLRSLDQADVERCLDRAVDNAGSEVNWDVLLTIVVCYITSSRQSARHFKEYIVKLVTQATTLSDANLFFTCLIFARQAALEGAHVHVPYQRWFQERFEPHHSSRKVLHFIIKHLTTLVPFEPVYCLEAHVNSLPRFSAAQAAVGEYISLAKARLNELKDTNDSPSTQSADSSVLNDVEEMVKAYNSTGNIPSRVLQASLFQRPYFVNKFLCTLLSPSLPGSIDPDGLIRALERENKIPQKMLTSYYATKSKIGPSLSGTQVNIDRVDDRFQTLQEVVVSRDFDRQGSKLISKLSIALSDLSLTSCGRDLNWNAPNISQGLIQLADLIVNHLCHIALDEESCHGVCQEVLHMLTDHHALHKPLLVRLWELLHNQITEFSNAQSSGVASLCYQLWLSSHPLPPLFLHGSLSVLQSFSESVEVVLEKLPHTTTQQMNSTASFSCKFLSLSLKYHEKYHPGKLGPTVLLTKLRYLSSRITMEKEDCSEVLDVLSQHSLWKAVHVGFVQWLKWELDIQEDPLASWERDNYLCHLFYDRYVNNQRECVDGAGFTAEAALCLTYTTLSQNTNKPGFSNLLPLLLEICNSLPPHDQPSLLKALENTAMPCVKSEVLAENPPNHLRLLSHIPAHFLFTNGLGTKGAYQPASLHSASGCLKMLMVHSSDVVMDTTFTHYICKGLLAVEGAVGDTTLCQQFIHCSSLFSASLTCCWLKLKHLFPSRSLPLISTLSDWLNRCSINREIPTLPTGFPFCVLAACLVKLHLSNAAFDLTAHLSALPAKAVFVVADFAVRLLTAPLADQHKLLDLVQACTSHCPAALGVCSSDIDFLADHASIIQSSREEFPFQTSSSLQQLPVILFKIIKAQSAVLDKFLSPSSIALLLPVVLLSHKLCLDLASSLHSYQTLEDDFVEQCTTVTKKFITTASTDLLQNFAHLSHSALKPYIKLQASSITTKSVGTHSTL